MATITCKQCNYVNEAERVYCHNCGNKLDRSLLPEQKKEKDETPEQKQRRVKKLVNPNRGIFAGIGRLLFGAVLQGLIVACLIQMARPAEGLPAVLTREQLVDAPAIPQALQSESMKFNPQTIAVEQDAINKYLQGTIKGGDSQIPGVKFARAFVQCAEDRLGIVMEHTVFGYPIHLTTFYRLEIQKNALVPTNIGGLIGHLPLHPAITAYGDTFFGKLWETLKREREVMNLMAAVKVRAGDPAKGFKPAVVVTTRGR